MGPGLLYVFCPLGARLPAAVSAFLGRARLSPWPRGRLCGMAGASRSPGRFPWGLRRFVRPSSPGWPLPLHLTLLLLHRSSHGLSFPQPRLSPRYLDLFLKLLLFFPPHPSAFHKILDFSQRNWHLTCALTPPTTGRQLSGASRQPPACLPSRSPGSGHHRRATTGRLRAAGPRSCREPLSPGGGFGDRHPSWSSSSEPSIPAQPSERMAGLLELRQLQQLEPGRIKVLIACDN